MNKNQVIQEHRGLVISVAKRYQGQGLDLEDLIQEGYIGLLKACDRYKDDKGTKFSTYARHWVRMFIVRAIENTGSLIRVPTNNDCTFKEVSTDTEKSVTIDSEVVANDLLSKISKILLDNEAAMFYDYVMNDMSFRQLADKYGVSKDKARYMIIDIKNKLLKRLNK